MKKFIIERNIPSIGDCDQTELKAASKKSCHALKKIGPKVQWIESYVTKDKTFCVYLAEDEKCIKQHAELSEFPANTITQVQSIICPLTAG